MLCLIFTGEAAPGAGLVQGEEDTPREEDKGFCKVKNLLLFSTG